MTRPRLIVAEPPAAYLQRPKLVVDASVMSALVYAEANAEEAFGWMRGRNVCAPHLVDAEVTGVGMNKLRRRSLPRKAVEEALELYSTLEIERYAVVPFEVFGLAHRYLLTTYDACYLWLAGTLGAPLATFDARLGAAAQKHLGGARGPG